jgi:hypothetical protein
MHKILIGTIAAVIAAAFTHGAVAATAKPARAVAGNNAAPAAPANSVIAAPLRTHLVPGAPVYAGDKVVASLAQVDHTTGNVVIAELKTVGKLPPLKHVVAASALSWNNGKLVTELTSEQIAQAPTY